MSVRLEVYSYDLNIKQQGQKINYPQSITTYHIHVLKYHTVHHKCVLFEKNCFK